jgi:hypothetical protein
MASSMGYFHSFFTVYAWRRGGRVTEHRVAVLGVHWAALCRSVQVFPWGDSTRSGGGSGVCISRIEQGRRVLVRVVAIYIHLGQNDRRR